MGSAFEPAGEAPHGASTAPRLSIVFAVQRRYPRLDAALEALRAQQHRDVEVLLCHPAADRALAALAAERPWLTGVAGRRGALVPDLWRDGILAARAPRIALAVSHCPPAAGWVDRLLAADLDATAAVGGPIDMEAGAGPLDWAIHLLRYLPWTLPLPADSAPPEPAGDNALYRSDRILPHRAAFEDGFWESEVHALMKRDGDRFGFDPELRVVHCNDYRLGEFMRQRYLHGRRFGHVRASALAPSARLGYALTSVAAPLILGAKVARRSAARPRARAALLPALPWLAALLCAWGVGEVVGAWRSLLGRDR